MWWWAGGPRGRGSRGWRGGRWCRGFGGVDNVDAKEGEFFASSAAVWVGRARDGNEFVPEVVGKPLFEVGWVDVGDVVGKGAQSEPTRWVGDFLGRVAFAHVSVAIVERDHDVISVIEHYQD